MNPRNALPLVWVVAAALAVTTAAPAGAAAPAKKRTATRSAGSATKSSTVLGTPDAAAPKRADSDSSRDMTLRGGEEGTVFRTLTVQGEDRIHIEVERPTLQLDMDPEKAPGLERGDVKDVLERTTPDFVSPLLGVTSREASPWVGRPWLAHFPEGAVARMRPDIKGAERWRMVVVNARAESVAVYQGKGDPPREIAWDGRSTNGDPVLPGASYSYVFEARDKAGNKRNFVGEGFRVSSFRYGDDGFPVLLFAGSELPRTTGSLDSEAPPIVAEAASVMNQAPLTRQVMISVTARNQEQASSLALRLSRWMKPLVIGDPARFRTATSVQSDAPVDGAVKIAAIE